MKVKECEKCEHYKRVCWSHNYQPINYHSIGMSHAYAFCEKYQKRCLEVKNCEEKKR